jgi:hypothetical protein
VPTLTLVVHDLPRHLAAARSAHLPNLQRFLARADAVHHAGIGLAAWLCRCFGIDRQHDWPVGAVLASAEAGNAGRYWLCADPVSLAVDRDRVLMLPPPTLTAEESAGLFASLKSHLEGEDLAMVSIDTGRWCIGCSLPQHLSGTDPELAVGRDIRPLLPRGDDAPRWLRLGTELQMLLHDHPLNLAREARGEAPANGVWLWGGGRQPQPARSDMALAARERLALALARLSGAASVPLQADLPGTLEAHAGGDLIVLPPDSAAAHTAGDAAGLDSDWLAPAWRCLATRRFDRLRLVGLHGSGVAELQVDRAARWKFWRRRRSALAAVDASA